MGVSCSVCVRSRVCLREEKFFVCDLLHVSEQTRVFEATWYDMAATDARFVHAGGGVAADAR